MGRSPSSSESLWAVVATRVFVRKLRRRAASGRSDVVSERLCHPVDMAIRPAAATVMSLAAAGRIAISGGRFRFNDGRLQRLSGREKESPPRMCPSPGSRFHPWSARRLPTSCLVQDDSRVPICDTCSNAVRRFGEQPETACIIGNRVPARGHRWSATFRRGSFLLSLSSVAGMQPRLSRPKCHRFLTREPELGAIPPHSVKHYTDTPG